MLKLLGLSVGQSAASLGIVAPYWVPGVDPVLAEMKPGQIDADGSGHVVLREQAVRSAGIRSKAKNTKQPDNTEVSSFPRITRTTLIRTEQISLA